MSDVVFRKSGREYDQEVATARFSSDDSSSKLRENVFDLENGMAVTREEIAAHLATSEAKNEALEARVERSLSETLSEVKQTHTDLTSKFDKLTDKFENLPSRWTTWGAALSVAGVVLAALALAGDRFDGGVGLGAQIGDRAAENRLLVEGLAGDIEALSNRQEQSTSQIVEAIERLNIRIDGDAGEK